MGIENLEGSITMVGNSHSVEYEPGGMTGLSTLYLRVNGVKHCVPIHINAIDGIIDMLWRGKAAIEAFENTGD